MTTIFFRMVPLLAGVLTTASAWAQAPDPTLPAARLTAPSETDVPAARPNAAWDAMAPMSTARAQPGAVAHPNGSIYVFGGYDGNNTFNSTEAYNITTNTWSARAAMPSTVQGMATALGRDGNIYTFGGRSFGSYTGLCYRYNPTTNAWTSIAPMPVARWYAQALTASDGRIYVLGGWNADQAEFAGREVQIYTPTTNTWSQGTPMPAGFVGMAAAADRAGLMHLYGGISGASPYPPTTVHYVYNTATNTWTTGPSLPAPARGYTAGVSGSDGFLYLTGGDSDIQMNGGAQLYDNVNYYNPTTSTWSTGTALPLRLTELRTVAAGNYIYTLGGLSATNTPSATLYRTSVVGTPLPVELVAFTAEAAGPAAQLRWATASEKNSAYFVVEASPNGREFREAGRRAAQGNSTRQHTYQYTDHDLARYGAPLVYYRLRQVDLDGTFSYSPVRILGPATATGLAVFPNPSTGTTTLTGAAPGQPVQVLDALGRQVATALTDATGRAVLQLPSGTPGGLYVVRAGILHTTLLVAN